MVVCSIQYTDNIVYDVYYAVQGDTLLGALCFHNKEGGKKLETYTRDLNILQTHDVRALSLKQIPIRFENHNYNAY